MAAEVVLGKNRRSMTVAPCYPRRSELDVLNYGATTTSLSIVGLPMDQCKNLLRDVLEAYTLLDAGRPIFLEPLHEEWYMSVARNSIHRVNYNFLTCFHEHICRDNIY